MAKRLRIVATKNQNLPFRKVSPWTVHHTASKWFVIDASVQGWVLQKSFRVKLTCIAAESALAVIVVPDGIKTGLPGFSTLVPTTVSPATLR